MKKVLSFILALVLSFSLLGGAAAAHADALPTLDEALRSLNSGTGRIEVSADLSAYDPENYGEFDYGDLRLVILERHFPQKAFTGYDSGYPDDYRDDLPDDFVGEDLGEPQIFLRGDIMNRLPKDYRAKSLDEADVVLIAENEYFWGGTISVADYADSDDGEMPEFDSVEEMADYIAAHQPVIESITYYPKFGVYSVINLYDPVTKVCEVYDYTMEEAKRFARNPAAQDAWSDIDSMDLAIFCMYDEEPDMELVEYILAEMDQPPAASQITLWKTAVKAGDIDTAIASMTDVLWDMAEKLAELDLDADHRANYRLVIDARDYEALSMLVDFCDYGGFDTPIETIRRNGDYIAEPDWAWIEAGLEEFVELFE